MLTDKQLRTAKGGEKVYKVTDQQGLYAAVLRSGNISFRYDYRLNGRRETLVIGKYDPDLGAKQQRELPCLEFGMSMSLAEARLLLSRARKSIEHGISPSRAKVERRIDASEELTFEEWGEKYLGEAELAESTRASRRAIFKRHLVHEFGRLKLEEITPSRLMARCERIKEGGAVASAIQSREIMLQIFRFVQARGLKIENPASAIRPSAIGSFRARERALSPTEIHRFFTALEEVAAAATLRLAIKFILLTMVRKSELIEARWEQIDFESATWTIPKERMKAGRPHNVYLSRQAMQILMVFKTWCATSPYLLPGRYELKSPISKGTLNRLLAAGVEVMLGRGEEFAAFTVHDLRRTASTLLHEAGYSSDWIEKCLAHEQKGVRAVYNRAEYAVQRRTMLQDWADMVDCWISTGQSAMPQVDVAWTSATRLVDSSRTARSATLNA